MNESEFRDWARAALRSMDEKLERLAKERAEPKKVELDKQIKGRMEELIADLNQCFKDGQIAGLAIAFVNHQKGVHAGYVATDGYFQLAGAASYIGLEIMDEFRKHEVANENREEKTA
jgi:hypothetical protein